MTDREHPDTPANQQHQLRTVRLRYTQTSLLALGFVAICALPAVYAMWPWGVLIYVALAIATYCVINVGANITADAVTIKGALYSRRIPRSDLAGLTISQRGGVFLLRTDGSRILVPTARPRDLPRLRQLIFDIPSESP